MSKDEDIFDRSARSDPITGEPGFHPIGTVAGGTSGAMAGAAVGSIGGPIGIMLGAVAGGLVGGLAGDALAELMSPADIDQYWRREFEQAASEGEESYDQVKSAIYFGTQERLRYGQAAPSWSEIESELAKLWRVSPLSSGEEWTEVRETVLRAFSTADEAIKRVVESASAKRDEWTRM